MEKIKRINMIGTKGYLYEPEKFIEDVRPAIERMHGKEWYFDDDVYYILNENEYNGYIKALRIIKDRSLQEVKKSEADEHGYRFLDLENDGINNYIVRKATPYSVNMDFQIVWDFVKKDLLEYYEVMDYRIEKLRSNIGAGYYEVRYKTEKLL